MKSSTETIIAALRILSLGRGGVAAVAIAEAADRLAELQAENVALRAQLAARIEPAPRQGQINDAKFIRQFMVENSASQVILNRLQSLLRIEPSEGK